MKKTYIAPKAKAYQVHSKYTILEGSPIRIEGEADEKYEYGGDVKGQLENESISIWDLY